jgi:hypothetical protein
MTTAGGPRGAGRRKQHGAQIGAGFDQTIEVQQISELLTDACVELVPHARFAQSLSHRERAQFTVHLVTAEVFPHWQWFASSSRNSDVSSGLAS